jgi:hypothetical protein
VSASTGNSAYKCVGCKRFTGVPHTSIPSLRVIRRRHYPRRLSSLLRVSVINYSLGVQLEAVLVIGIFAMEMVRSLVVMVSKLSSEVQRLRIDNETLKTQLHRL